ncbi:MAG: hypothetical protein R3362_01615 [Rhodothermales bacterium]|nr:hypothetical protein [Rhodothermales bacterium]
MVTRSTRVSRIAVALALVAVVLCGGIPGASAQDRLRVHIEERGGDRDPVDAFAALDASRIPTGLLHDRVVSFVDLARFDGTRTHEPATIDAWRQVYSELSRSGFGTDAPFPEREELDRIAAGYLDRGLLPLAVIDVAYDRIRADAFERGLLRIEGGRILDGLGRSVSPYETRDAFAVMAYRAKSPTRTVRFVLPEALYVAPGAARRAARFEIDLDDGGGWRPLPLGGEVTAAYATAGAKTIRVAVHREGETRLASTTLVVPDRDAPAPDRTWLDQRPPGPTPGRPRATTSTPSTARATPAWSARSCSSRASTSTTTTPPSGAPGRTSTSC